MTNNRNHTIMDNKKPTTTSSQVMELKELISGPLIATIDADSISSRRYLDYLFELAFESYDRKTGTVGEMRHLTFTYNSHDVNGVRKQKVSIPLLTLVPLPLLQVKEADFDFDIQIVDAVSEDKHANFSFKGIRDFEESGTFEDTGTRLRVSLAPDAGVKSETSVQHRRSATMKVAVKMRQADMPGGLINLLGLTANNFGSEEVVGDGDTADNTQPIDPENQ